MAPEGGSNPPPGGSAAGSSNPNDNPGGTTAAFSAPAVTDSPFETASTPSEFRSVQFARPRGDAAGDFGDDDGVSSRLMLDDDDDDNRDPYDRGGGNGGHTDDHWPPLRRRRSSVGARLAALTDLGGVNSIRSFTRSFQRAAGFTEVIPQRPAFFFAPDQEPVLGGPYDDDDYESAFGAIDSVADAETAPGSFVGTPPAPYLSLLRQHLEAGHHTAATAAAAAAAPSSSDNVAQEEPGSPAVRPVGPGGPPGEEGTTSERKGLLETPSGRPTRMLRAGSSSSLFALPPHLATANAVNAAAAEAGSPPVFGSPSSFRAFFRNNSNAGAYGSVDSPAGLSYGAMTGHSSQAASMAQAGALWRQQQAGGGAGAVGSISAGAGVGPGAGGALGMQPPLNDGERPAILVKEVEEDGKIILTVEGQSTLPQTIFNSINVLIGVGLLSLPMGIKYAGWLCGMVVLFLAAAVTAYTARLLAKCMDLDPVVITFSDLAFISFGPRARLVTSLLFTVELMAACVALIVLFSDSLELLFPGMLSSVEWKILCCLVMVPLNFLPMRLLSVTSVIGIVCCFCSMFPVFCVLCSHMPSSLTFPVVAIVVVDGFTKNTTPGSLIQPAATYLLPANWLALPLSFGLLMSPWGGHSVFPNVSSSFRWLLPILRLLTFLSICLTFFVP